MAEFRKKRKKICHMCAGKTVDYKDVNIISKYVNDNGKILPRRFTGTCAKHQRHVAEQVKRARFMGFISFFFPCFFKSFKNITFINIPPSY